MTGFKSYFYKWVEQYLFFPNFFQKLVSVALFPFTILYCVVVAYKRTTAKPIDFGIPIISVGNLIVGGSGKTPVTIALASQVIKKKVAIILRGYGRKSKGLIVVSNDSKILEDVDTSGDEALVLAKSLPSATIIVSENRKEAIVKALELGAKIVFLDDGYRHHDIKKTDILLRPEIEPTNIFCLPSGGYRETKMMYSFADIVLIEEEDFKREVTFSHNNAILETLPSDIILLTAISKPQRLLKFLPKNIKVISYPDHYYFMESDIDELMANYGNSYIVTTLKDYVKLEKFKMKRIILMNLGVTIDEEKVAKLMLNN